MRRRIFIVVCLILLSLPILGYSYQRAPTEMGCEEMMEFVAPNDRCVKKQVEKITAECDDKWEGYSSIHYWVRENIDYRYDEDRFDEREYWKFPDETLIDEEGDCEDQAILRSSMLICYDRLIDETDDEWYVLGIHIISGEKITGHGSVIGNVDGYVQIYDYQFDNYGEIVEVDELDDVWDDYEEFWSESKGEGTKIIPIFVFNDESCEKLLNIDDLKEFLER